MRPIDEVTPAKNSVEHTKIKTHFAGIIVDGEADKPYYSILYYDPADNGFHQGFGSFCKEYVFKWLSEEFEIVGDVFLCEPVRHSRWVAIDRIASGFPWKLRCNRCGVPQDFPHTYCPNCGAKMDGGNEDAVD